jgi:excisionase family DNA binding protein
MRTVDETRYYLSVSEVALRLGVSAATIRRKIAAGELLAVQLGGPGSSVRVPADELTRWLYADPSEG